MHTVLKMMWDEPKYIMLYRAYVCVISRCLVSNEDVPCTGSRLALLLKYVDIINTAAQAVVHHRRSASGVDECGALTEIRGDSINSGHRWPEKRKLSTWVGTSKKTAHAI